MKLVFSGKRGEKVIAFTISLFFLLFFIGFQSSSVYGGDGGDVVSAAWVKGVAHPPGYPLYTFVGWFLTHIPYSTPAWRVGLLSSIPSAFSLGLFFLITTHLIKSKLAGLITTLALGFSYLFWLYASVPEVFALNSFFALLIFYSLFLFTKEKANKFLYTASFIFGLSLTHHHTILFLVPGYVYMIWSQLKKSNLKTIIYCLLYIFLGLTPYFYVIGAARSYPFINWENPQTFSGFYRLVTRAIYGSFRSGSIFGLNPLDRYLQLKLMVKIILLDVTKLGVGLGFAGMMSQFKKNRFEFWTVLLLFLFSGPLFIFYAGFPVNLNFFLGTSERFLLLPYLFFFIWIGYGIETSVSVMNALLVKIHQKYKSVSVVGLFFLLPGILLLTNSSKIISLKNDRTAEKLAQDVFYTVPDKAIVVLADDTTLFDTEYVYVTGGGKRGFRGIKFIQFGLAALPFYQKTLSTYYPELYLPNAVGDDFFKQLVDKNLAQFPIYSNAKFLLSEDMVWMQEGLLYKAIKKTDLMQVSIVDFTSRNKQLYTSYQDPFQGALGIYTHMMLGDVLRVYGNAYSGISEVFVKTGEYVTAEQYLRKAVLMQPDIPDNHLALGNVLFLEKKCIESKDILTDLLQTNPEFVQAYSVLATVYKDCLKDEEKAKKFEFIYTEKMKEGQTQLKNY